MDKTKLIAIIKKVNWTELIISSILPIIIIYLGVSVLVMGEIMLDYLNEAHNENSILYVIGFITFVFGASLIIGGMIYLDLKLSIIYFVKKEV